MNPVAFNPEWSPLPASFENPDDIEARAKGLCQESNYCEAIPLYEKLVELNHPKAKLELGRCLYIRGWPSDATFVEKILNEAAAECSFEAHYWLWKLNGSIQVLYAGAWLGDPKCQHALALEYYRGEQYSEAIKWARLSAASDYLPAHEFLASMSGLSLSPNHNFQNYFQAYYDLNKMTSKYDFQLGTAYLNGYGVFPDAQRALDHLLKAADQGDAHACYWVGQYYLDGDLVSKDLAKAVEYFTKASDSGFMAAKWELANLLLEGGEGVEKDVFKAVELLNQISDSRDPKFASASLNLLGHYYLTLSMTAKAMDCFFFASRDYDHPLASLRLGVMYYERSGIKAGEPFFEKAHQLGVAEATFYLGKLSLADGDKESAVKFFKKAAKQGVAGAYFEMGRMLETEEKGKGVPLIIKSLQKGYNTTKSH